MTDTNESGFMVVANIVGNEIAQTVSEVAHNIKTLITDPNVINQIIAQEIRAQHCKNLEGNVDNGGTPIPQLDVEKCIAFATGDMKELQRLTDISTSNTR